MRIEVTLKLGVEFQPNELEQLIAAVEGIGEGDMDEVFGKAISEALKNAKVEIEKGGQGAGVGGFGDINARPQAGVGPSFPNGEAKPMSTALRCTRHPESRNFSSRGRCTVPLRLNNAGEKYPYVNAREVFRHFNVDYKNGDLVSVEVKNPMAMGSRYLIAKVVGGGNRLHFIGVGTDHIDAWPVGWPNAKYPAWNHADVLVDIISVAKARVLALDPA